MCLVRRTGVHIVLTFKFVNQYTYFGLMTVAEVMIKVIKTKVLYLDALDWSDMKNVVCVHSSDSKTHILS